MIYNKDWWTSKTIWTQIVSALFAIGALLRFDVNAALGMDEVQFLATIMLIVAVVTSIFRVNATAQIGKPSDPS